MARSKDMCSLREERTDALFKSLVMLFASVHCGLAAGYTWWAWLLCLALVVVFLDCFTEYLVIASRIKKYSRSGRL